MGFFDRLVSAIRPSSEPQCPTCGSTLDGEELIEGSYWCDTCGVIVVDRGGDLLLAPPGSPLLGVGRSADDCGACQSSLSGGTSYMPYEDGSNTHAYIICPSCGAENIRDGFGE